MIRFELDVLQRLGLGRIRPSDALTDRLLSLAEPTVLFATVVAFALTLGGLEAGYAAEANPVVAELFATIGYAGAGLLAVAAMIGAFRVLTFWKRTAPRTVSLGAVVLAAVSLADAGRNLLFVLARDADGPIVPPAVGGAVALVALFAAVWVLRRPLGQLAAAIGTTVPSPSRRRVQVVLFAFVMVSSVAVVPFAGGLGGGTAEASAGSGGVSTANIDTSYSLATTTASTEENATVYVGSRDNSLYAIDASTGDKKWSFATGDSVMTSPTVANSTVYFGSNDNNVYAVDASTGDEKWNYTTAASVAGDTAPTIVDGVVYIGSEDGDLYALDASTGDLKWRYTTGGDVQSAPTVSNGTVYVGSDDNNVYAINASTGNESWSYTTGNLVDSSPTVSNGTVYVGSADNSLYALDASTGQKEWNQSTGGTISSPTVLNGTVYVGSADNSVYAFDASTGNQQWSYATGSWIDSSPTVANGIVYIGSSDNNLYALDASTGDKQWSYTAGDYVYATPTVADDTVYVGSRDSNLYAFDATTGDKKWNYSTGDWIHSSATYVPSGGDHSTGTRVELETLGHIGPSYASGGSQIAGAVRDQNGNPVENASVVAWGVREPALDPSDADTLEQQAEDLKDELSNPLPSSWNSDYDLENHYSDASGEYALVHAENDWGLGIGVQQLSSNVGKPNLQVDSDQQVVISIWDADDNPGLLGRNQVDNSYPGSTQSGTIVVEQLSPTDEVVDRTEYETETIATTGGAIGDRNEHHGVRTSLPEGVYRAYPKGSPSKGYTFIHGSESELIQSFRSDLRDQAGQYTDRAQRIRDMLSNDDLQRVTTQTDANGRFTFEMDSKVVSADVKAMKVDGQKLDGVSNPTLDDLREIQAGDYNGSYYLPSPTPTSVSPPETGVSVTVYRSPSVPMSDMSSYADLMAYLQQQRLNSTVSELQTEYEERFEEMERQSLERVYQNHRTLVETVGDAEYRYLERSEFDTIQDAGDLEKDELETETRLMQLALADAGEIEPPEPPENPDNPLEISDGKLSGERPLPSGLNEDSISVELHASTGDVETVPSDYWSVESSGVFFGTESVVVEDYPVENTGAAAYTLRVQGANDNGRYDDRIPVTNPAFDGMVPEINAVDFSTLAPGDGERVYVGLDPAAGTGYDQIVSADAYGPDGSALNATVNTTRDRASFVTADTGVHYVRLTYQSDTGDRFTISERVRALETPRSDPATIRTAESVTGTYAVIGEQLESARVETESETTSFTAIAPADETIGTLAIKPGATVQRESETFDISVVEGSDETPIGTHVSVAIHLDNYPKDAIAWRNDKPVTQSGETRWGKVDRPDGNEEKGVLRTYTDADGQATVELNTDPGRLERLSHWMAYTVPLPSVPFLSIFGSGSALIAGLAVVFTRRRRNGVS